MNIKLFFFAVIPAVALVCSCSSKKNEEATVNDTTDQEEVAALSTDDNVEAVTETAVSENWMPDSATVLPSGLGIVIDNPGQGDHPLASSSVTLNYRGRLPNGMVFDSSYDRGQPATFPVANVIAGFGEGIMQLGRGGKASLYIPSNLGYGEMGTPGGPIGPNQNLIFDIEIIDFN